MVKAGITDSAGIAIFQQITAGTYLLRVSSVNYSPRYSDLIQLPLNESNGQLPAIILKSAATSLQEVTVLSKKPFIQQLPGKTIINVDAGITNAGTTAMEVLEKSPGVNQNDIQEILEPTGQISAGVSKQVLKTKGTVRLTVRDIFYTQAMEGLTHFKQADEYFKLQRDTRVCTIGFTYRFGKSFKSIPKRTTGAGDEMERVDTGN